MTTTNHTPIRARFARKPYSLDEVLHNADPSAPLEPIEIELHKELTEAEYDAFATTLLQDRDWQTSDQKMIDESLGFSGPKRVHTGVATINRKESTP